MFGKCNLMGWLFLLAAAALTGCSRSAAREEAPKKVYEGTAKKVEYHLDGGQTVIVDDNGERHPLEGFPMMFTGKIEVSESAHEGERQYGVEILPLTEQEKVAATPPAATSPSAPASEYE